MGEFLESLRRPADCCRIEQTDEGFTLVRKSPGQARAFNELARTALRRSGVDYVALPRTDGLAGYDRVFIIPTD